MRKIIALLIALATPALSNAAVIAAPDCSINTDGWCLSGSFMTGYRGAMTNASNFGSGGTVNQSISLVDLTAFNSSTLAGVNAVLVSWWNDAQAAPHQTAIINWFLSGGNLLLFNDDTGHDSIGDALGVPTLPSNGSASNDGAPLFLGPFGAALNVTQAGNTGRFDAAAVAAAGGTVAGLNAAGEITAVVWDSGQFAPGAGRLILIGDVDMVSDFGATYSPLNDNGVFGLNAVAYLIGTVPAPSTYALMLLGLGMVVFGLRRRA